jgi:hypothetical protein
MPIFPSHTIHQEADLIVVELGVRGNTVDIPDDMARCAQYELERQFAVASTQKLTIPCDAHSHRSGSRPVVSEQASEEVLKVIVDAYPTQFLAASWRLRSRSRGVKPGS